MSDPETIVNPEIPVIRIEPSKGWVSLKLGELWEYRELLYFLTWRDIKVRYKQTALGGPTQTLMMHLELRFVSFYWKAGYYV
jgi:hypothetical protein